MKLCTMGELNKVFSWSDEISNDLSLIKGGGGAHTNEKIIASASKNFLCCLTALEVANYAQMA